ncbi:MAG: carbohydrate ABC transporter permease [Thermomicrobiales bacterium]|nr:carbohydrate ABC transporter permease [Thermomicrobiales bacterium]
MSAFGASREIETERQPGTARPWQRLVGYALLILTAAIAILPLLWAVAASFTPLEKVTEYTFPLSWKAFIPVDFTLEAYRGLLFGNQREGLSEASGLVGGGFARALWNSLVLSLATVLISGLASALAGFAFARFRFRGQGLLFAVVVISIMIPTEVIVIPLYISVRDLGLINTWPGVLLPMLANGVAIFLFRQAFAELPQDLIDAARVDGASWARIFAQIALPLTAPVLVSAALFLFLETWNAFFWPLLAAPQADMRVVQVAVSLAKQERRVIWNQLMAGSLLAAIVPILLMIPLQRYYVRGLVDTGLRE